MLVKGGPGDYIVFVFNCYFLRLCYVHGMIYMGACFIEYGHHGGKWYSICYILFILVFQDTKSTRVSIATGTSFSGNYYLVIRYNTPSPVTGSVTVDAISKYSDVTLPSWHIKSWVTLCSTACWVNAKEKSKTRITGPLWVEYLKCWRIPLSVMRKAYPCHEVIIRRNEIREA